MIHDAWAVPRRQIAELRRAVARWNEAYGPFVSLTEDGRFAVRSQKHARLFEAFLRDLRKNGVKPRALGRDGTTVLLEAEMEQAEALLQARSVMDDLAGVAGRIAQLTSGAAVEAADALRKSYGGDAGDRWFSVAVEALDDIHDHIVKVREQMSRVVAALESGGSVADVGNEGFRSAGVDNEGRALPPPEPRRLKDEGESEPEKKEEREADTEGLLDLDLEPEEGSDEEEQEETDENEETELDADVIGNIGGSRVMRRRRKLIGEGLVLRARPGGRVRAQAAVALAECAGNMDYEHDMGGYRSAMVLEFGPVRVTVYGDASFVEERPGEGPKVRAPLQRMEGWIDADSMVSVSRSPEDPEAMRFVVKDDTGKEKMLEYAPRLGVVRGPRSLVRAFIAGMRLEEKWGKETIPPPSEAGRWTGYTVDELCGILSDVYRGKNRRRGGKPVDPREVNFAIRAKSGWRSVYRACGWSKEYYDGLRKRRQEKTRGR